MELDFIDISQVDGQKRVHASGVRQTSKSKEKINRSVFLDVDEDMDVEAAIYRSISRKAAGNGNSDSRVVRRPDKSIVNIDVSRNDSRQRYRTENGGGNTARSRQGEVRRRREVPDWEREQRRRPGRSRTADRERNPASDRSVRSSAGERRAVEAKARREREIRRKRRRCQQIVAKLTVLTFMTMVVGLLFFALISLVRGKGENVSTVKRIESSLGSDDAERKEVIDTNQTSRPVIQENFLTVNEYSRPGEALEAVNNIFVHYTANKGTSAAQNRSYFENLGITGETSASAHFIIGFDGEIVQCIPLDEIAYAVQKRNYDSISIECCYLQEDGKFTDATYQSLIRLCAWLLNEYNLAPEDMRRHYDEGGKKCPLYYVEHEDAWEQFLEDLRSYIMEGEKASV